MLADVSYLYAEPVNGCDSTRCRGVNCSGVLLACVISWTLILELSRPASCIFPTSPPRSAYHVLCSRKNDHSQKESKRLYALNATALCLPPVNRPSQPQQGAARGKLKVKEEKFVIDKSDTQTKGQENAGGETTAMDDTDRKEEDRREGEEGEQGEEEEDEDEDKDNKRSTQGPVDPLRMSAAGGKESAFFQDSGAVPTKLVNEDQEVRAVVSPFVGQVQACNFQ